MLDLQALSHKIVAEPGGPQAQAALISKAGMQLSFEQRQGVYLLLPKPVQGAIVEEEQREAGLSTVTPTTSRQYA